MQSKKGIRNRVYASIELKYGKIIANATYEIIPNSSYPIPNNTFKINTINLFIEVNLNKWWLTPFPLITS